MLLEVAEKALAEGRLEYRFNGKWRVLVRRSAYTSVTPDGHYRIDCWFRASSNRAYLTISDAMPTDRVRAVEVPQSTLPRRPSLASPPRVVP